MNEVELDSVNIYEAAETQEGVVRLEMFTESIMAATLQFIYTGDVVR